MSLDMFFKPDVSRILNATLEAMQSTAAAGSPSRDWQDGYLAALRAVAAGFGLSGPVATYEIVDANRES